MHSTIVFSAITIMRTNEFTTDSFRDLTFDLLSSIAKDPTKFDEHINAYLIQIHQREDEENLKQYTREIYEKVLRNRLIKSKENRCCFLSI